MECRTSLPDITYTAEIKNLNFRAVVRRLFGLVALSLQHTQLFSHLADCVVFL